MDKYNGLRKLFSQQCELCFLYGNDNFCDVANSLISVFYDLGIGEELDDLISEASKRSDEK